MFKFQTNFIQQVLERNATLDTPFSKCEILHILQVWYTASPFNEPEVEIGRIEALVSDERSELACMLIDWA